MYLACHYVKFYLLQKKDIDLRMRRMCIVIASLSLYVIFQRVRYLVADSQQ